MRWRTYKEFGSLSEEDGEFEITAALDKYLTARQLQGDPWVNRVREKINCYKNKLLEREGLRKKFERQKEKLMKEQQKKKE